MKMVLLFVGVVRVVRRVPPNPNVATTCAVTSSSISSWDSPGGAATNTAVSTVIDCQEIFLPPSVQPPNVEVCSRATITITITNSDGSYVDYQVIVDDYINAIILAVEAGVFTDLLQYLVVEEGSTDLTGVPTSSPSGTPTMAPVVPTTVSKE